MKKHEIRNAKDGSWTALISQDGLEVLTKGTSQELRKAIKIGSSFVLKIRPLQTNLEGLFTEVNALRTVSREVAFSALDAAISHGYLQVVGYETGSADFDNFIDAKVFEDFGIVLER